MPEDEDNDSDEANSVKMYATGANKFDEPTLAIEEPTKEINLSTKDDAQNIIISLNLTPEEECIILNILKENKDTFAWTYEDMPDLDPALVEHRLPIKPGAKVVKQKLQKLHPKMALQVKEEVDKLHKVKFIKAVLYPQWVANIVSVIKKSGQVQICIDF